MVGYISCGKNNEPYNITNRNNKPTNQKKQQQNKQIPHDTKIPIINKPDTP